MVEGVVCTVICPQNAFELNHIRIWGYDRPKSIQNIWEIEFIADHLREIKLNLNTALTPANKVNFM